MALPINHSLREEQIECHSASIGTTPAAAYVRSPFRGKVLQFGGVTGGVITTTDSTVTVAINGTTIGTFVITVAGAAAGQHFSGSPTTNALATINESDVISFTPAGSAGASIPGMFYANVQAG